MSHRPEKRTYVSDAAHMPSLLELNPLLPPMFIRFTEYLGGIIAGASHSPSTEWKESRVRCRRRPGHRPCPGPINVRTGCEDPPEILWECPSCGEHGVIRNWQGCEWDNSEDRWNLFEAEGACEVLERAMDMNPADELARENLKRCQERMAKRSNSEKTRKHRRPVRPPSD